METRNLPFDEDAIAEAARLVLAGEAVAVPTETVYGLAADATNARAVARIYEAKRRPDFNPLIVHVSSFDEAQEIAEFGRYGRHLAAEYWPGPLTIVAPLKPGSGIASIVTAGLPTVGIRVPAHRAIRALLAAVGRPLAAPSANASGSISPTRAEHVLRSLGGRIPLVIDDGPCPGGIESTIVAETDGKLRLLRRGPITIADARIAAEGKIEAPGQLASHYAPTKPVRPNAKSAREGEYLIGFADVEGDSNLSPSGDLVEAAARLFDLLHQADESPKPEIAIAPVPGTGLGAAINDRIRRAAAPR
ncbi:MAG TPA: L-threonylcarbamoyladenylate synthase [Sphingomicrobium sp.]|nr:L-threonylcarbamoyladenylate synthase [Sphingomicrobium sp.]